MLRSVILTMLLIGCAAPPRAGSFSYLRASSIGLRTTHAIPLAVEMPQDFRIVTPTSRTAIFNRHPYEVTLGGFIGSFESVMVHAERVADGSGASNYDSLPESGWAGFRMRSQCADIAAGDVAEEHDLAWLSRNGWNPTGSLALRQYFKTTPDHNQEVVVSLLVKVTSCDDAAQAEAALDRLKAKLSLRQGI